jgi:predicted heme/steroid binding protein
MQKTFPAALLAAALFAASSPARADLEIDSACQQRASEALATGLLKRMSLEQATQDIPLPEGAVHNDAATRTGLYRAFERVEPRPVETRIRGEIGCPTAIPARIGALNGFEANRVFRFDIPAEGQTREAYLAYMRTLSAITRPKRWRGGSVTAFYMADGRAVVLRDQDVSPDAMWKSVLTGVDIIVPSAANQTADAALHDTNLLNPAHVDRWTYYLGSEQRFEREFLATQNRGGASRAAAVAARPAAQQAQAPAAATGQPLPKCQGDGTGTQVAGAAAEAAGSATWGSGAGRALWAAGRALSAAGQARQRQAQQEQPGVTCEP